MDEAAATVPSRKKKELVVHGNICWFCKREGDEDSWNGLGQLHQTKNVKIEGLPILYHEPCAAYCSGLGEIPSAGIDEREIEKWYKYGERASNAGLKCAVCGLRGATAGCSMKQCSKSFHYTCARIAAFQGKAYFSVASRNVSCDKHAKWLPKPIEGKFMGMWMEGLGGWHGGLHQQAHSSWLPHLEAKHAEFQAKWLTASNYPLTLLSPKPALKLPGSEGCESDALNALASLCAERVDKPEPSTHPSDPMARPQAAAPSMDVTAGGADLNGQMAASTSHAAGNMTQTRADDNPAYNFPSTTPHTNITGAAGAGLTASAHRRSPTDPNPISTIIRNPSNQENVKPSSPFLDVQIPAPGEQGTGTGFTQKVLGSNLHPGVHQLHHQQAGTMQHLKNQAADSHPDNPHRSNLKPDRAASAAPMSLDLSSSQPSLPPVSAPQQLSAYDMQTSTSMGDGMMHTQRGTKRSHPGFQAQPHMEGGEASGFDAAGNPIMERMNSLGQHMNSQDLSRSQTGEGQQQLAGLDGLQDDIMAASRMARQRNAPSRYAPIYEGGEGGDVSVPKPAPRKRPSSAGGSSMLANSGGAGSTLEGDESEYEEGDSELGIYEPAKKKPKKFRFLKEVYSDPTSKYVPSPPSRYPRPTPTPRLVKKRRTPNNSAPTSPAPMSFQLGSKASERPASRGKSARGGNITPSGSLEKPLSSISQPMSQPLSQPSSPVSILITPPAQAGPHKKSDDITMPTTSGLMHVHEPLGMGLDLQVLLPENVPTGLTGNVVAGSDQHTHPSEAPSMTRAPSLTRDGTSDGGPSPVDHPYPSTSEPPSSSAQGRMPLTIHPTSTLRERCKPLQIDTSAATMRGTVEPAPDSVTSVSPTHTGFKRTRIARKDTSGIASSGAAFHATTSQAPEPPPVSEEEDLIDVADAHLLGSAPHSRLQSSWPGVQPSYSQGSQGIVITQGQSMSQMPPPNGGQRQGMHNNSRGQGGHGGSVGPQLMPYQDESQLGDSDQYGDEPDMKFDDHQGLSAAGGSSGQPGMAQHQRGGGRGGGAKEAANQEQPVNKVNMLLNNIQQIWVPEGMSGPEIAALAAQQNQQGPIHLQPLIGQPTIFTSNNMGVNGAPAMFAPIAGMNPHTIGLLPRFPYLPHKMMSFANGLTPTGRPSRSTRCAVCIIQKKGKCGTEQAPKNCLRRNQNLLGIGNGFAPAAAGMHPIQFQMQHPAMLQVQGGQAIVASPLVSPLVSPLPSPLPSPNNQFGSILVQQQPMGGVSSAMLMQTPHGLQIAGGYNMNARQVMQERMMSQHSRGNNARMGGMHGQNGGSNLSGGIMQDQVLDLGVNGSTLRPLNTGSNVSAAGRRDHVSNQHKQMGGTGGMMRGLPEDNFNMGGMNLGMNQTSHFMDTSGLDHGLDDFQTLGSEWVQDPNGLNLMGTRMSGNPAHMMHPQDMLQDDMDHGDIPGPESPFPRAQDRIQIFSGCVDILPPLVNGEERVLGITMHPRYAARFHAHMRSDAGQNAPLVALPHNTAVFLQQRKVNPEIVVESLRGLIQESLLDPDVQPRFGLPDDLPVRGVDRFIVPPTDPRIGVHGQWGLRTNEDVAAGTAIGAYGSYAMFREDHERFATNPPSSYRSVVQASSRAVLDASWELLVESNAVSSTLPASLGAGALGHASRGLGEEEVVMCALGYGNLTALANDPIIDPLSGIQGDKENTHVLMFLIHGWPLPIMVTLQDLPVHTEVLYSYGQAYWDLIAKCQQQLDELRA